MPVTAARIVLFLYGLMFLGFGLAFLLSPLSMASMTAFQLLSPAAVTELRAFYGGLEIGLGAYLLAGMLSRDWMAPALQALVAVSGGIACGRIFGMLVDDSASPHVLLYLAVELLGVALGAFALYRVQRQRRWNWR